MRPPLHLRLQAPLLLTLLAQPLLQLLLLLPHALNAALQLQHPPLALDGKVRQACRVSLTLAEDLWPKKEKDSLAEVSCETIDSNSNDSKPKSQFHEIFLRT